MADVAGVADAAKLLPQDSLATVWLNLDVARKAPGADAFFKTPRDPAIAVQLGSYVDALSRAPYVCGALAPEKDGLLLTSLLDEDLRGRWEGSWSREGDTDMCVTLEDGRLTLPMTPPAPLPLRMVDEGQGRFRAKLGEVELLGSYQRQDERIVLCWRGVDRGRPARFSDEDRADTVILRRVRAGR